MSAVTLRAFGTSTFRKFRLRMPLFHVRAGKKPPKNSASSEVEAILHQNFRKLKMKDDILIRETRNVDGTFHQQYVMPNTFVM